jgi:hypothetical protein
LLTFRNLDSPKGQDPAQHTITGCKAPCDLATGGAFRVVAR